MLADVAATVSAVAAIAAVIVSYLNSRKITAVHVDINSRMTQLIAATGIAARADGIIQGRKDAQDEKADK